MSVPFSQGFADPAGSPIRELFPYLGRPGMISFAGGYPSPGLFDTEGLQAASEHALHAGGSVLQYGSTEGIAELREALSALMLSRDITCPPDRVLVTTGSQQAFDILVRIFMDPGDVAYVEAPAYPATLQALRLANARIIQVPVDADGLDVDQLASLLRDSPAPDRPKLLYTVPTFSNPSGATMSARRRQRLIELALEFGFMVVEDDPYSELAFTPVRESPLYQVASRLVSPDRNPVIYLSSLSKTVAPALRIGWMVASSEIMRRSVIAKQTMDLCTSPVAQKIAALYLGSGRYPQTVTRASLEYRRRMNAMVGELRKQLGNDVRFAVPDGGMFLWGRLEGGVDPVAVFREAVDAGVVYVPGTAFFATDPDVNAFRFSYAAPDCAQIQDGVERFAAAVRRSGDPID